MGVSKVKLGIALLACVCAYVGVGPAMAEEGHTVWVAVVDAEGTLVPEAFITYATADGEVGEAIRASGGTYYLKNVPDSLLLDIEPVRGVKLALPSAPEVWVVIHNDGRRVFAEVVSAKTWPNAGPMPTAQGMSARTEGVAAEPRPRAELPPTAARRIVRGETPAQLGHGDAPYHATRGTRQGGEDCGNATVIGSIPYSDTGTTVDYADDYDASGVDACPYSSTAPDVVYMYTPSSNMVLNITLCNGSLYDTKLYVYENGCTGDPIRCNDDACPGYVSMLMGVEVTGGNTYYIVIDGYGTDAGTYFIDITEPPPPAPMVCPDNTLYGQTPHGPDDAWTFGNSEVNVNGTNYLRYDSYSGVVGEICDLHWWGGMLYLDPYAGWTVCEDSDPAFDVKFYADAGGVPGAVVCEYNPVYPTIASTGVNYAGILDALYFSLDPLDPCCMQADGWVSIQGLGDADCWFMWLSSPMGDGWSCFDNGTGVACNVFEDSDFDLSLCLTGVPLPTGACCPGDGSCIEDVTEPACIAMGGEYQGDDTTCDPNPCPRVFGACCDDWTFECIDCVELFQCPEPGRFVPETLCEDMDPACGEITGACCNVITRECTEITPSACAAQSPPGLYYGHESRCEDVEPCPCFVFCEGTDEGEPDCGLPEDTVNGGCSSPVGSNCCFDHYPETGCDDPTCEAIVCAYDYWCCTYGWDDICAGEAADLCGTLCAGGPDYPYWGSVSCGETICGSGAFDGSLRDTDWYEIVITEEQQLWWTVKAEFPVVTFIIDGTLGCDGGYTIVAQGVAGACEEVTIAACLPAGTYWLWVGPDFLDPFACDENAEYSATLTCGACPTGACCPGDGSCVELSAPACAALPGYYVGDDTTCDPNPCLQNDGCVNAEDVGTLPATVTFNNGPATDDIEEPCGVYSGPFKNVWYSVVGTGNDITVTSCTAGTVVTDTKISVFCNECDNLICVGGNDDDCVDYATYLSTYTFCSEVGEVYYITVGTFSATTTPGVIQVDITDGSVCYDPPNCEPATGACCVDGVCTATTLEPDCAGIWFEGETCPEFACPVPGGEDCANTIVLDIPGALPYTGGNTTCFKIDDYEDTCLGYYDGGEDIIYELNVTADTCVNITVNEVDSYSYLGVAVDDACPPGDPCMAYATSGNPDEIQLLTLTAGTYYMMIDTWPSPECAAFNLAIVECPTGGACCHQDMSCTDVDDESLCPDLYMGDGTSCATVDCPPLCPDDTLNNPNVGQPPYMPDDDWTFGTSEVNVNGTNYLRYESFSGLTMDICDIHWWGGFLYLDDYAGWIECTESDPTFDIVFYNDASGAPGTVACSYTVTATYVSTGLNYGGLVTALYFTVDPLTPCCTLSSGWVSIQGLGDDDCWHLWLGSPVGDGLSYLSEDGGTPATDDLDLSLCLTPPSGDVYGACCNDDTGICVNDILSTECVPPLRFSANTACIDQDPPCGFGACCDLATGGCTVTNLAGCTGDVEFMGYGTDCDPNPCPQPCVVDFSVTAPGTWTGDTTGQGDDCDLHSTEDVMFEVEIPSDGTWMFALCDSTYDTWLAVGTTCCGDEIGYEDDGCYAKALQGDIEADITAGTYYVDIEGYSGTGPYELDVYEIVPPTGACCVDEACTATTLEGDCAGDWYEGETCPPYECPSAGGSDCDDTILVNVPGDLDFSESNTTCGKGDEYADTCMGSWDGGEDMFYELEVTEETCVIITVTEVVGYSYFGMVLEGVCPPATCDLMSDWGDPDVIETTLAAGTYYLMLDHYPTPYCEAFDISIVECPPPPTGACCYGEVCEMTSVEPECEGGTWYEGETCPPFECPACADYTVTLPAALPYSDANTTEGMVDDWEDTCMGSYDGGEDAIYELVVTEQTCVDISLTEGNIWMGFVVDDSCPPDSDCLAVATSSSADSYSGLVLAAGTYYLMVDIWPTPEFATYTLDISACAGLGEADDWEDPDGDEIPNVCDNCPDDPNADQADGDGDGFGDACDLCPDDDMKSVPGQCGCGNGPMDAFDVETDTDGDGVSDCVDDCVNDPMKSIPGMCGCRVGPMDAFNVESDEDDDGVPDCCDACPFGEWDPFFEPASAPDSQCVPKMGCDDAIPTVSQWGLIVMALLLLVAGKIYFGRRSATA